MVAPRWKPRAASCVPSRRMTALIVLVTALRARSAVVAYPAGQLGGGDGSPGSAQQAGEVLETSRVTEPAHRPVERDRPVLALAHEEVRRARRIAVGSRCRGACGAWTSRARCCCVSEIAPPSLCPI